MTRERPILFSSPMVRAILAGEKTVTRRVVAAWPDYLPSLPLFTWFGEGVPPGAEQAPHGLWARLPSGSPTFLRRCPYGESGDRLYVKEAVRELIGAVEYVADGAVHPDANWPDTYKVKSLPSMYMPRLLARVFLRVESVRVERLHEIDQNDALAEGTMSWAAEQATPVRDLACSDARLAFLQAWDSINGKRPGCAWADNPWVWRVEFRRAETAP